MAGSVKEICSEGTRFKQADPKTVNPFALQVTLLKDIN
jgi:hypothetical protein